MNTNILKKCLEELSKDEPKLDYVRGMLETLIEMSESLKKCACDGEMKGNVIHTMSACHDEPHNSERDEASILEAGVKANLETIKNLNTEG